MMRLRVSVLLCLILAGFAFAANAQDFRTPTYTSAAASYSDQKLLVEEAAWYVKAFGEPVKVFKGEMEAAAKHLGISVYEISQLSSRGQAALRTAVSGRILERAEFDPIFEAALNIAREERVDVTAAVQATQLAVNVLVRYVGRYPKIAEPIRALLLERLKDERMGVRFTAITGLGYSSSSPAPREVLDALVEQLQDNDQLIVDAAAAALGNVGDRSVITPMMKRFLEILEDEDPAVDSEEAAISGSLGKPSDKPLNQARLTIANAVNKLAGLGLELKSVNRGDVIATYLQLTEWWDDNEKDYQ